MVYFLAMLVSPQRVHNGSWLNLHEEAGKREREGSANEKDFHNQISEALPRASVRSTSLKRESMMQDLKARESSQELLITGSRDLCLQSISDYMFATGQRWHLQSRRAEDSERSK